MSSMALICRSSSVALLHHSLHKTEMKTARFGSVTDALLFWVLIITYATVSTAILHCWPWQRTTALGDMILARRNILLLGRTKAIPKVMIMMKMSLRLQSVTILSWHTEAWFVSTEDNALALQIWRGLRAYAPSLRKALYSLPVRSIVQNLIQNIAFNYTFGRIFHSLGLYI